MMELLSPAGGYEALVAAVQSGADAVYMGFGAFNARRSARKTLPTRNSRRRCGIAICGACGCS